MSAKSASPSPSANSDTQDKESIEGKETQVVSETTEPDSESEQTSSTSNSEQPHASTSASPAPQQPEVNTAVSTTTVALSAQGDWQAIWSPQHNAYYFFNSRTNETTWTNPLENGASQPSASSSSVQPNSDPSTSHYNAQAAAAAAQGIDSSLAYLDPTLGAGPSNPSGFSYTARFNARTGTFAKPDARNPDHVSEYERMKRMSEFYFDVNAWEQDVEQRKAEEEAEGGKKRKKPTKKDLVSF